MEEDKKQKQKVSYPSVKDFVYKTRELLKEEEQSEIELFKEITKNKTIAEIEALGYGLANMMVTSTKRGYYGKTVISLTKAYHSQKNPILIPQECKLQVGDDVALYRHNSAITDGVVSKRQGPKLQITTRKQLDNQGQLEGLNCNVVVKWNQVTFGRYFKVLQELENSYSPLLSQFFVPAINYVRGHQKLNNVQFTSQKLNEEQIQAVQRCMKEQIFFLHGPPGTGKTTTVCQAIVEAVKRGSKVLACGPSNISVDNIVEGICGRVNCIRIGNPARIIQNVIQRCLDSQIAQNSGAWKNEVKKLQAARRKLSKNGTKQEKKQLRNQIKDLKDEIYNLQQQVIQQILHDASVLCCTNVGAADKIFRRYLSKQVFDLVVIDECGQALEVSCWIPLLKGRKVLLAGDHKQLPPTIKGNAKSLLSYTLFSRAMQQLHHIPSIMLEVQYRMNTSIMGWSNQQFYHGKLRAHNSVESHTLRQLCIDVKPDEQSLLFIDTAGCGMGQEGGKGESKRNVGEADLAIAIYKKLLNQGVLSKYIAILTPYSKQVALIKSLIGEKELPLVDVSTVDGIQGRQKECILISMVRSNSKREIGFLKDWRRMNVAVTRARRMLILLGNVQCVTADQYIKALVQWVQEHGHVSSAEEWGSNQDIRFGLGASDKIQVHRKEEQQKGVKKQNGGKDKKKKKERGKDEQVHKQHTQDEQASIKEHFRKVFEQMARQLTINNATGFERKMIHEVAQQLGICHETSENKKSIKIWRKMTNDEVSEKYAELERIKMEQDLLEESKREKKRIKRKKRQQTRKIPQSTSNKFAEQLQAFSEESSEEQIKEQKEEKQQNKQQIRVDEPKSVKKRKKKQKQQEKEEDIEELMKQFTKDQPKQDQCFSCNKKITSVTKVECKFCRINFCRSHVLAEQHGCGQIAINEAKRVKVSEKQLQKAAQKLKEQIKKQEQNRKKKVKEDKK